MLYCIFMSGSAVLRNQIASEFKDHAKKRGKKVREAQAKPENEYRLFVLTILPWNG